MSARAPWPSAWPAQTMVTVPMPVDDTYCVRCKSKEEVLWTSQPWPWEGETAWVWVPTCGPCRRALKAMHAISDPEER